MTSIIENKTLNDVGTKALEFWQEEYTERMEGNPFKVRDTINSYLSILGLTANVIVSANPKPTGESTLTFRVYSGLDGDFDYEGYINWNQTNLENHLFEVLELLGIKCYE